MDRLAALAPAERKGALLRLTNDIARGQAPLLTATERRTAVSWIEATNDDEAARLAFGLLHESGQGDAEAVDASCRYLAIPGAPHRGSAASYLFEKAPQVFASLAPTLTEDADPRVAYVAAKAVGTVDRRRGVALKIALLARAPQPLSSAHALPPERTTHALREALVVDIVEEGDEADLATLGRLAAGVPGYSSWAEALEGLAERLEKIPR